jgi:TRAP-type C4-dicarboxylate transport system permease small subunit
MKKRILSVTGGLNWMAAAAIAAMMFLTCADVALRLFRRPIPGTYELVGFLGAIFVSFSLAQTSMERGHIAVDFLVQKFSPGVQKTIECISDFVCSLFFCLISWQSILYAGELNSSGEVSMTLQMPIHPFVYGIALGCGVLSIVLFLRFLMSLFAEPE